MGPVETAVRSKIRQGACLKTPTNEKPFWVGRITAETIALELGAKRTKTHFPWPCLEGTVPFLQTHVEVQINGSGKSTEIVRGTLDGYFKEHINRLTAGWVAVLLEEAGVVLINRNPPATVRLSPQFLNGPIRR